jgi:hypothetical protein
MSDPPVDQGRTDQRAASQNPIKHEQFHGMGQKGQARFAAIAIRTLQDLATANAATVESALKANGYSPGLTRITDWITQAQDLISDVSAAEVEPTTESSTTDETVVETRMSETEPESTGPGSPDSDADVTTDWTTFASFTVNFEAKQTDHKIQYQTSVHQTGTDSAQTWEGIEETELQTWLLEHLASTIPTATVTETKPAPAIAERLGPYISDLRIFQLPVNPLPMRLYQPSLMFPSPIKSNLPFTLELQFGIPVPEAEPDVLLELGQPVTYTVECYARSLVGKEVLTLGKLEPQQLPTQPQPFVASLPAISLPPGIFRLQLLLNLQNISAFPAYFEVPVLQVD